MVFFKLISGIGNKIADSEPIYKKYITKNPSKVLEVSTGFGINTDALLKYLESVNGTLVSIDVDSARIEKAKKRFREYVEKKALFLEVADATSLPYEDALFDYVVTHTTLHHIDNVEKALGEMMRVLRTDGKLIIIDLLPSIFLSVIPGHGRKKLRTTRSLVLEYMQKRAFIVDEGKMRFLYYLVASKTNP